MLRAGIPRCSFLLIPVAKMLPTECVDLVTFICLSFIVRELCPHAKMLRQRLLWGKQWFVAICKMFIRAVKTSLFFYEKHFF